MTGELERKEDNRAVFHWTLKAFSSLDNRVDSKCESPSLSFSGRHFVLFLYPNGRELDQSEGDVVLSLVCLNPPLKVRYLVGIATAKGGREVCGSGAQTFDLPFDFSFSHGSVRVIERSKLFRWRDELLPQDVLTLTLELKVEDGSSETGRDKIVEDIAKLWLNSDHTDALLKVKNVEFRVHRTILAARIPVLGAMFHHDTTEKASGEVSIDDCEPEIFEQFLHYIYKGAPREVTADNASALYALADKYLVSEVKHQCLLCLRDTLCLDAFCDTLTLSLMHGEDELLNTVTDFFSRNMVDVMKTVEWQRFMGEHTTWANEITIRATELTAARHEEEKKKYFSSCF